MRIAKASLIDPERNGLYATCATALSVFVFAYSTRFGQVSILAYYALWLPLILIDYRRVLGRVLSTPWIVAFVGLALLSTFWSAAPGVTARASVQFATHVFCALLAVNLVSIRSLTRGMVVGTALVMVYSLIFGHYSYDALDGTYSFVGAFSSKNQLGLYASLGIYFALASVFILGERGLWRLATLASVPMAGYGLFAAQSATSVLATVAALAITFGFQPLLAFRPRHRKALLALGIVVLAAALPVVFGSGVADSVLGIFGKDTTLTGRTYLWSEGIAAGNLNPVFGAGYYAYWVQGFGEAERLWYEFYIATRSGFHFHNTYIELYVELGLVGVALMAFLILRTVLGHLGRLVSDNRNRASHLLFGLMAMFLIRSFVEIDVMTPYTVGAFLMFYAAGLLAKPLPARAPPGAAARPETDVRHSAPPAGQAIPG
ncbi:O-antigen ligase family protein [Aureimonas frigidaquae]|uniref:O-antigen ligase family protein n=1 Tax=Aureimonas frigidaquae TaxID=424757 RepID=UPI000781EE42|nr:O-antigen ligase [Aureimonas frigidaquae]